LRDLEDRKIKNILNLKMNELTVDIVKEIIILLGAFNSLSPRFFFFFDPALLGSPNKTVKVF
jgi:hypothetical protein